MAPQPQRSIHTKVIPQQPSAGTRQGEKGPLHESQGRYNVLMITPVYPPNLTCGGGVAVTCGALTDKLIARGCTVNVFSPRLDNVDCGTSTLYPSFPVMFPTLKNLYRFNKAIRECDIIVCPDNTVMPFLLYFSHLHNKPLFFNLHTNIRHLLEMSGTFGRWVSAPLCDMFIRVCSNLTARTFTTSPSYREVLLKRGYRCDGCFSPRIKLAVFEKHDSEDEIKEARKWLIGDKYADLEGTKVILYVGRFSHEKRIDLLVRAKPSDVILAIVGNGPGKAGDDIEQLHDPLNGVLVHREMVPQERLRVLYKASDFLVSASKFETLGMTVCEANICSRPVIVQDATGFNTQVIHGKNGFLVNFDNADETRSVITKAFDCPPTAKDINNAVGNRWDKHLPNLEDKVLEMAEIGGNTMMW
eukprot:CAMPEP_0203762786 /NCGR_PEP_ID=MMETSP0098-20131031/15593_1 /ASSEMBLY_ACC=CAM_ASM_000208 /TAXON_ID=96639 /ORGANISM=" , Strain NY0313808BC1" /LENGTH=414 /DNA_ID=CAMNT_0050657329 /DNA_START=338 /DNA_END=1579 /DNA_ORIENTATION=-